MADIKYILGPMRLPFLILTPACVALGFGTALWSQGNVSTFQVIVEADRGVGRKHLPIVIGRRASSWLHAGFLMMAYLALIWGVYSQYLPRASLVGLATVVLAVPVSIGAYRYAENVKKLIPSMGVNVAINILTPVLVSIGLII